VGGVAGGADWAGSERKKRRWEFGLGSE